MKKLQNNKGFTLIELLVVITIIGILATGAVATYTSQIQKARDTTRINDIKALQSWVEQFYQDAGEYPSQWASFSWVVVYTPKIPKDPKTGQECNGSSCDYAYQVNSDANTVVRQEYELSIWFENAWTKTSKWGWDGWNDPNRLEIWIDLGGNDTRLNGKQALNSWVNNPAGLTNNACVNPNGTSVAWWDACVDWTNVMVIR